MAQEISDQIKSHSQSLDHELSHGLSKFVSDAWSAENNAKQSELADSKSESSGSEIKTVTQTSNLKSAIDGLAQSLAQPHAFRTKESGEREEMTKSELLEKMARKPVSKQLDHMTCNWKVKELTVRYGTTHGHSRASDGMGTFQSLYEKGAEEGQDVTSVTEHNHDRCRAGEKGDKDQDRIDDQAKSAMVADDPSIYIDQLKYCKENTNDKHVDLTGLECGTIKAKGPDGGPSGNHTIIFEATKAVIAEFHESDQHSGDEPVGASPHESISGGERFAAKDEDCCEGEAHEAKTSTVSKGDAGEDGAEEGGSLTAATLRGRRPSGDSHGGSGRRSDSEDALFYMNGDYTELAARLKEVKDITGQAPIVCFAHPDERSMKTDYGINQFGTEQKWLSEYVHPYVRVIELIKGKALTRPDVKQMSEWDLKSAATYDGYLDKGVQASPVVGRDNHWGDPGGRPAMTGFLSDKMTQESILEAMRERRTFATTDAARLDGFMTANDNQYVMGNILDSNKVKELDLSATIGGDLNPDATYALTLFGDERIGDGKKATVIQTIETTGQKLKESNGVVDFDPVKVGRGDNAYYRIEVARQDPNVQDWQDRLFMAPIWVQPKGDTAAGRSAGE